MLAVVLGLHAPQHVHVGVGLMDRLATEGAENISEDVIGQAVTTRRIDPRAARVGWPEGVSPRAPTERSVTGSRHSALVTLITRNTVSMTSGRRAWDAGW